MSDASVPVIVQNKLCQSLLCKAPFFGFAQIIVFAQKFKNNRRRDSLILSAEQLNLNKTKKEHFKNLKIEVKKRLFIVSDVVQRTPT